MSDTWPDYLPPLKDHFHAVGVLAATFNALELKVLGLMVPYLGFGETTLLLFNKVLDNPKKIELLRLASAERAETPQIADAVSHFCDGFNLCNQNRNIIIHSSTQGTTQSGDTIQTTLRKLAKDGGVNEFSVSLDEIRQIADDTFRFNRYGGRILFHVLGNYHSEKITPAGAIRPGQPLPDKPPLPKVLSPRRLQAPKDSSSPPEPSAA